ncbi:hypothetical protein NDU88_002764 [Pleurodeles waltl]|uniref:Uncharacterized protein n=1 Tax=Pleurodeles waltl TaxID=8319 RepID=A0AAV7VER6_PLEWA|nr:hypothetical protein NDU88_002764 [Pleurodeles waltl]
MEVKDAGKQCFQRPCGCRGSRACALAPWSLGNVVPRLRKAWRSIASRNAKPALGRQGNRVPSCQSVEQSQVPEHIISNQAPVPV